MYQSLRLNRLWPLRTVKAAPGLETFVSLSVPAPVKSRTMEHQFRIKARDLPANIIGWRRLRNTVLGGLGSASLLFTSGTLFGSTTSIELSPLIYKSTLVAPADGNQQIGVVLALPSSDPVGLKDLVKHISTPGDPLFRRYITPQQFAQKFGGKEADYTALKDWATANGLVVSQESAAHTNLTVRASVSQFQRLFKTQLNTYRATDGQIFYSASIKPTVPAEIAAKISGVIGLTAGKPLAQQSKVARVLGEEPLTRSDAMRVDTAGGTGPGGTYSCTDLRTIYAIPTWGVLEKGMVVAVFEQGYYRPSDVKKYFLKFGLGNCKQTVISVDQSPIDVEPAVEGEDCLDIDMLVGMNPHIAEVKVFIDDYQYDPFSVAMVDAFQAIAEDGTPQIVSVSYGEDEGYFGSDAENAENTVLQQLAAEGITVLASSGDGGAFGDGYNFPYNVSDPCADPYVTGVGGTSMFTGPHDAYYGEVAWDYTGGGISTFWPTPVYQYGVLPEINDQGSQTYRNVPDVAAVADPLTGVGIYVKDYGGWVQIGGTSLSCPVWAGFLSTVNAALHWSGLGNLGFFNPYFYSIGIPKGYSTPYEFCYDITNGYNGSLSDNLPGFYACVGYDNCTGNGSLNGNLLAGALMTYEAQPGTPPGGFTLSVEGKPTATSATVSWTPSSGAKGYIIQLQAGINSPVVETILLAPNEKRFTFRGLTPRTPQLIQIFSYNASGSYVPPYVLFNTPR
jgi:kumamolisin